MMEPWAKLTVNGKALATIQIVRLLFGIYLAVQDWVIYDDSGSAVTVLIIYAILGIFTAMFICGKRYGLHGILGLSVVLIVFNTIFTVMALNSTVDAGLHSPTENLWATVFRYVFFLLTLVFSIGVYRENRE